MKNISLWHYGVLGMKWGIITPKEQKVAASKKKIQWMARQDRYSTEKAKRDKKAEESSTIFTKAGDFISGIFNKPKTYPEGGRGGYQTSTENATRSFVKDMLSGSRIKDLDEYKNHDFSYTDSDVKNIMGDAIYYTSRPLPKTINGNPGSVASVNDLLNEYIGRSDYAQIRIGGSSAGRQVVINGNKALVTFNIPAGKEEVEYSVIIVETADVTTSQEDAQKTVSEAIDDILTNCKYEDMIEKYNH